MKIILNKSVWLSVTAKTTDLFFKSEYPRQPFLSYQTKINDYKRACDQYDSVPLAK